MYEEKLFYLTMCIYDKFNDYICSRYILLDLFYDEMCKLCGRFNIQDDTNKDLLTSVYDYINVNYDEIRSIIEKCSEETEITF